MELLGKHNIIDRKKKKNLPWLVCFLKNSYSLVLATVEEKHELIKIMMGRSFLTWPIHSQIHSKQFIS